MISKFIFKLIGWKAICELDTAKVPKAVIVAAPHTTNWDFLYTILGTRVMGVKINFMIKDSFFFFPLNILMKTLGGIPVDRSKKNSLVSQVVEKIDQGDINYLIISAEGTRSYTEKWKSGFYYIAQTANIPLHPGYIDYKEKVVGIGQEFVTSGQFDLDLQSLKEYFKKITPLYKHKSSIHS